VRGNDTFAIGGATRIDGNDPAVIVRRHPDRAQRLNGRVQSGTITARPHAVSTMMNNRMGQPESQVFKENDRRQE